jgi:Fe-S cluster biogenesis protein NfuA
VGDELDRLLDRVEELLAEVDTWDDGRRAVVLELLDGVDALHRAAVTRLGEALGDRVPALAEAHPAVAWLFEAYGVGGDPRVAAQAALEPLQPYLDSHGGVVEVVDVVDGVVTLRLAGSCAGCSGSAATLRDGVEQALRSGLPGFAGLRVEEEAAAPYPPPQPLLQISRRPPG